LKVTKNLAVTPLWRLLIEHVAVVPVTFFVPGHDVTVTAVESDGSEIVITTCVAEPFPPVRAEVGVNFANASPCAPAVRLTGV
jgi:hypothetical protein